MGPLKYTCYAVNVPLEANIRPNRQPSPFSLSEKLAKISKLLQDLLCGLISQLPLLSQSNACLGPPKSCCPISASNCLISRLIHCCDTCRTLLERVIERQSAVTTKYFKLSMRIKSPPIYGSFYHYNTFPS